ncbi:hypothetical protein GDO81_011139 [Engystomops pustulosus]|uniref:Uncharacterized protein n=1 Tax=Engystomops pustulosus TaxID=76066 RepID=A0AAV7BCB4_ENGPU|nr:hypothetical protein GDO81_011139 [Engystomops pustulosus]
MTQIENMVILDQPDPGRIGRCQPKRDRLPEGAVQQHMGFKLGFLSKSFPLQKATQTRVPPVTPVLAETPTSKASRLLAPIFGLHFLPTILSY